MTDDQLELLASAPPPDQKNASGQRLLGLILDEAAFFNFLGNEWLTPSPGYLLLGVRQACGANPSKSSPVEIWFDVQMLPDSTIRVWRDGAWAESTLCGLTVSDNFVSWSGPLPTFAVDHFCVSSEATKVKLLALARNFADMEVPSQPFKVRMLSQVAPPEEAPPVDSQSQPPGNWDALRGAAAMAAFAVPAIDPWVELLCDLVGAGVAKPDFVENLHASWWRAALWSNRAEQEALPGLWQAIVSQFSVPGRLNEWRAKAILHEICEHARSLGESETRLARLSEGARSLLDDRGTVEEYGTHDDLLALTLQLLLLRPSPEKFAGWRSEWPAIPPVVWWTGMTLAGYLQGYRSLPTQFRGTAECRKLLALKTWQHAWPNGAGSWNMLMPDSVAWRVDSCVIVMTADTRPWCEHKLGTRGSWYRATFENPKIILEAEALALDQCPDSIEQWIVVENTKIPLVGNGVVEVPKKSRIDVSGRVEFEIGNGITLEKRLNISRFKNWLATGSISRRVQRPSGSLLQIDDKASPPRAPVDHIPSSNEPATKRASSLSKHVGAPIGLKILPSFIGDEEEGRLVEIIDALEWDRSMKRRVQHYGWRYDYKARKVTPAHFLGPLPDWAEDLAGRLLASGVVWELPDQVIVNNYEGTQGISKHIDCKECFRGPIVTISLLETWEMAFTRKIKGETEKFVQPLLRYSAVVLDGDARSGWHHEIPERLTERGVRRGRRVSITFRKVAI